MIFMWTDFTHTRRDQSVRNSPKCHVASFKFQIYFFPHVRLCSPGFQGSAGDEGKLGPQGPDGPKVWNLNKQPLLL